MAHHGGAASPAEAVTSVVPVPDAIAAIVGTAAGNKEKREDDMHGWTREQLEQRKAELEAELEQVQSRLSALSSDALKDDAAPGAGIVPGAGMPPSAGTVS